MAKEKIVSPRCNEGAARVGEFELILLRRIREKECLDTVSEAVRFSIRSTAKSLGVFAPGPEVNKTVKKEEEKS